MARHWSCIWTLSLTILRYLVTVVIIMLWICIWLTVNSFEILYGATVNRYYYIIIIERIWLRLHQCQDARTPYKTKKRQKGKDMLAVKSNVTDATRAMDSSGQTVPSSAVSWMWHRPADCSTHEPRPPETHGLRLLTGASQARRVCSLMPSEDIAWRRGPSHTGGRWQGTTEPGRL